MLRNTKHPDNRPTSPPAPRIPPLESPFESKIGGLLTAMMPAGVPPIALFRTFVVNPTMTAAMHTWGSYELSRDLSLTMRQREIVIDRTCARCRCEYEWGVHILFFAERVGLTDEQIASLTHGSADDPCWTDPRERTLIAVADSLHDTSDVDDALWDRLDQSFEPDQILDLLLLCGWYHALSYAANGARVPLEAGAPRFADHRPGRAAEQRTG